MARYYFDIMQQDQCIKDNVGVELTSADAVRETTARVILDLARDEFDEDKAEVRILVRDDTDYVIFTGLLQYSSAWH